MNNSKITMYISKIKSPNKKIANFIARAKQLSTYHDNEKIEIDSGVFYDQLLKNNNPDAQIVRGFSLPKTEEHGVGSELKKLLSGWPFYMKSSPTCKCNARVKIMNQKGIEWCQNNIDTIVGWLREEASRRKLIFIDYLGKWLVKKSIKLAKKNITKEKK